ncbi:ComF family protein [Deltaproteobacteria bacterium]|nr:ComF family protein [Deltaproteobacteria bacterium]
MGILSKFIDIIYPPRCHICHNFLPNAGHRDNRFCPVCLKGFLKIIPPLCPICGIPFESFSEENHLCENCLRKRPFYDALGAPYLYQGGIMDAIHQMKYGGKSYFAKSLGALLGSFASKWIDNSVGPLMMPVPLHPRKLRERGFNQSLLLARAIMPILGTELDFLSLKRVIYTRPQTGLNRDERKKNVRNVFDLMGHKGFKGRSVILVDDVATTGNTMNECARILKKAGCKKIFCLALARTKSF